MSLSNLPPYPFATSTILPFWNTCRCPIFHIFLFRGPVVLPFYHICRISATSRLPNLPIPNLAPYRFGDLSFPHFSLPVGIPISIFPGLAYLPVYRFTILPTGRIGNLPLYHFSLPTGLPFYPQSLRFELPCWVCLSMRDGLF